jgi:SAM-dependent methyltransferase
VANEVNELKAMWDRLATQNAVSAVCWRHTEEQLDESGKVQASLLLRVLSHVCWANKAKVLDFGAGVGRLAKYIAPQVASYVLADVSPVMLVKAQERLEGIENCCFVELSGYDLLSAFPEEERGTFDFCLSDMVFPHLDRELPVKFLEEIRLLLKPHGRCWFQVPVMKYPARWEDINRGDFPANIRRWQPGELLEVCVRLGWSVVAADLDGIEMVLENPGWTPTPWAKEGEAAWVGRRE